MSGVEGGDGDGGLVCVLGEREEKGGEKGGKGGERVVEG